MNNTLIKQLIINTTYLSLLFHCWVFVLFYSTA